MEKHALSKKHSMGKKAIEACKTSQQSIVDLLYEEMMREFTRKEKRFLMKCVCFGMVFSKPV